MPIIHSKQKSVSEAPKKYIRGNPKLQPITRVKASRSFVGMVNFLSMFCPELQKLLNPIYDLSKNGQIHLFGEKNNKTHLKELNVG